MEKAWFAITWAGGPVQFHGPFGDDAERAKTVARENGGEGERAIVLLEIEPVDAAS